MEVGCVVRARRSATTTRRAVIATLHEQEGTACLLFWNDDDVPRPLQQHCGAPPPFLVAPLFAPVAAAEGETEEATVPVAELMELFDFERQQQQRRNESPPLPVRSIQEWKECGDQLLKAGDAVSAVAYYEYALHLSSTLQIGATVLIQRSGRAVAAEVDCIDNNNDGGDGNATSATTIDVTILDSGDEKTVKASEVLLCLLLGPDNADHLQERILLNLTRCLLQLAESTKTAPTTTTAAAASRRPQYLKRAVLAATLALAAAGASVESGREAAVDAAAAAAAAASGRERLSPLEISALLLRSQAQADLGKFPQAAADAKKVLGAHPRHRQGRAALQRLERLRARAAKLDKRLAKNVSQWVQAAMTETTAAATTTTAATTTSSSSSGSVVVSEGPRAASRDASSAEQQPSHPLTPSSNSIPTRFIAVPWVSLFAAVVLAWLVQKSAQS